MNWKAIVQKMFNRIGYDIRRTEVGTEYTLCPPYPYVTYSPWFGDWFQGIYSKIKDYTSVKEDRCYIIHEFCRHCSNLEGDFAECGVYKGGTAFLIAYTLKNHCAQDKELHLFDTFAGMPAIANKDPSDYKKGDFGDVSFSDIKNYLQTFPFIVFHRGLIPETFGAVENKKFAFVHIDVDLYQSTKDCCSFFYDRMTIGGIMIIDDYGFPHLKHAAKQAVDEFFCDKLESPVSLRTGQCIVIKL